MKCCLVIGGTGFIGSFVINILLRESRRVVVIGRNEKPTRQLPDSVKYIAGDFGDRYFLKGVLQDVNEIIDLAYTTVPQTSYDNPVNDILENLPNTVNLLETASRLSLDKLVLISSGGVIYGPVDKTPIGEDQATNPISPYGITKLAIEKYAQMFHITHGLPVLCARPGNAYGETQKPFIGQGFIATAIASILKGMELNLYGETGTVRDYIYVKDVAEGIVAALLQGQPGNVYNIGSGEGRSNKDVLNALKPLAKADGFEIKLKTLPLRKFDVPVNILDSSKLNHLTGWTPLTPFREGLKKTWNWFQNYSR